MRATAFCLASILALVLSAAASADEVVLRSGQAHDVDILETGPDFIVVGFQSGETEGTVKVQAAELEPHSFYEIRNRYMEKTADNHLLLAKYCAENGMFTRAKSQADKARAIDPEYAEKQINMPGVLEGLAATVLKQAREFLEKGDLDEAERYASVVLNRLPDTDAGKEAAALIDEIEGRVVSQHEAAMNRAMKEAKEGGEEAGNAALEALEKKVQPLVKRYEAARKLYNEALKESNSSQAVRAFESVAKQYEALLGEADKLMKEHEEPVVAKRIDAARGQLRADAVDAYVSAGDRLLARGTYKKALEYANRALRVDPSNPHAQSLKTRTEIAQAASSRWRK
jgi:tetratricopeptide (TPR) repeat protein